MTLTSTIQPESTLGTYVKTSGQSTYEHQQDKENGEGCLGLLVPCAFMPQVL